MWLLPRTGELRTGAVVATQVAALHEIAALEHHPCKRPCKPAHAPRRMMHHDQQDQSTSVDVECERELISKIRARLYPRNEQGYNFYGPTGRRGRSARA